MHGFAAPQPDAPASAASDAPAGVPLTQQQRLIWAAQQFSPAGDMYNVPVGWRLRGRVDDDALDSALRRLFVRHPVLTIAVMEEADGTPVQRVGAAPARPVRHHRVAPVDLDARIAEAIGEPFPAHEHCRLRGHLFRTSDDASVLLLLFDHLAVDVTSVRLLIDEFAEDYAAAATGTLVPDPPVETGYFDYARRQRDWLAGPEATRQTRFWHDYLADLGSTAGTAAGSPGTGGPNPAVSIPLRLPEDLAEGAARLKTTPFSLAMSAASVTLRHLLASEDVLIGYPAVDWRRVEYEPVVGLFTDMLPYRCPPLGPTALPDHTRNVQETVLDCLDHQGIAMDGVWSAVRSAAPGGAGPTIAAMLSTTDTTGDGLKLPGLEVSGIPLAPGHPKTGLLFDIETAGTRFAGWLRYDSGRYSAATARRVAAAFERVLEQVLRDAGTCVADVELTSSADRALITDTWNRPPARDVLPSASAAFVAQARERPERVALVDSDRVFTYGELERASAALASRLHALGLPRGTTVALCLPRSVPYVAAALAVLRAGLAFLPVDPDHSATRRAFVLSDTGAGAVLLGAGDSADGLPPSLPLIEVGDLPGLAPDGPDTFEDVQAGDADPAYVITTSGSTGLPKAVVVPHRALVNHVRWKQEDFGLTPQDVFYFKTPPVYDASIWEFMLPLSMGASVVVGADWVHRDPARMLADMARHHVTIAQFVPTLLKAVIAEDDGTVPGSLRMVFAGGEVLDAGVADATHRRFGARLINLYGPTEAAIDVTSFVCPPAAGQSGALPIGRPVRNAQAYVLGPGGQLMPPGFPGELCVGGTPLALGYANRAEMTAQRFVPHPFSDDARTRLYRTGDLARFRDDGLIEYLGRQDGQLKVHGVRVEVGEIRGQLLEHPRVKDAVVVPLSGGEGRLAAYVVAAAGVREEQVREFLAERLPPPLVPAALILLEQLPVTASGKVDVSRLPVPQAGRSGSSRTLPRGPLENRLATLWAQVLGTSPDRVPRDATFFELGGSSIELIRLHRLIRTELAPDMPVTDLFKHPTVASVATALKTTHAEGGRA